MVVPRETILSLAQKKDAEGLKGFVKTLQQESEGRLADALGGCSRQQLDALWKNLQQMCNSALGLEALPHSNPEQEAQEVERMHATLHMLALLAKATLSCLGKNKEFPPALLQTAIVLHGVLTSLPEEEEGLRNALVQVCETWWQMGLQGREELALNALVHLLQRALAQRSVKMDMRRVWGMHEFLTVVDLDSALSDNLKLLLKRCLLHPSFLNHEEGKKFVSFLFTLNENLTRSLHATVKTQLPIVSSLWLEKYGDIYFRAWQRAADPLLKTLERDCIQDLMCAAVHAHRTGAKPLASALRKVLKVFHSQKKLKGVDEMLYRLYEPILWRALMMPNPAVRANATNLFFDAFPIQNPSANIEETDSMLQKQFDRITTLLNDPCATVRALATQGVCRIMSVYWELIPAPILRSFLARLVQELAWDAASAEVREATLRGLHLMLDNHHSHLALKPVLPQLCRVVHDTSEKVRIAMLDLLIKVKGIRAIKWWLVVPVEHLLKRLEVDGAPVVRRLMRLLFNSFVPLEAGDAALVERCLVMVESNVAAARVFFQNLPKHVTITDTLNYMTLLCRWTLIWARKSQQQNQSLNQSDASISVSPRFSLKDGASDSNIEREGEEEEEEAKEEKGELEKVEVLAGVLEVLVILWTTVSSKLNEPSMAEQKESLQKKLSILIPEVLKTAEDARAWRACVLLAARLPPAAIPMLSRSFHSRLRRMEAGTVVEDYDTMLEAMCKWRKADDVLELINDWLSSALSAPPTPKPSASKRLSGKRRVAIIDPHVPQPALALDFLRFLMRNVLCQTIVLQQHRNALALTQAVLRRVKDVIAERVAGSKDSTTDPGDSFLVSAFSAYLMLLVIQYSNQAPSPPPKEPVSTRKGRGRQRKSQRGNRSSSESDTGSQSRNTTRVSGQGHGLSPSEDQGDSQSSLAELEELMEWAAELLLPPLSGKLSSLSAFTTLSATMLGSASQSSQQPPSRRLCTKLLQELLRMCGNALLALELPQHFADKVSSLCLQCLDQVAVIEGYELFEVLMECLYRCAELHWLSFCQADRVGTQVEEVVDWLQKVYAAVIRGGKRPQIQEQLLSCTQSALAEMVAVVMQTQRLGLESSAPTTLMTATVSAMMEDLDKASQRDDLESNPVTSDLQPFSAWLLAGVGKAKAPRKLLLETLLQSVKADDEPSVHRLHSYAHLLHCLVTGGWKEEGLADCVKAVKEQFDQRREEFLPSESNDGEEESIVEDDDLRPVVGMISDKLNSCLKKLHIG